MHVAEQGRNFQNYVILALQQQWRDECWRRAYYSLWVLTACNSMTMKVTVSWNIPLCSVVEMYQHFRGKCWLHLQHARLSCAGKLRLLCSLTSVSVLLPLNFIVSHWLGCRFETWPAVLPYLLNYKTGS